MQRFGNKVKRVDIKNCVIGQKYYVECGIWSGRVIYCGFFQKGSRIKHQFTFGHSVDECINSFNIVSCKSGLKVYELI